jgi:hypothetical protein
VEEGAEVVGVEAEAEAGVVAVGTTGAVAVMVAMAAVTEAGGKTCL